MNSEMEWTVQTYRLDEIERKFDLPCVICVNEGYYSETDAEGFSQGDIMSIDSKMVLHKVAANFATEVDFSEASELRDSDYVELENEILVPLNYKGKLKVLSNIKNYANVRELANEFPRYAKVRENFTVRTEENIEVTIQAGSIIQLDRIIPSSVHGTSMQPDTLVIEFKHHKRPLVVGVPFNARGKFRTEPDGNEYTIQEAIDRYSLPQHVRFVDDEIKRVYTQDLLEGIENMRTITETLRLNRLVSQKVLVGHYKPLDETETKDTERFRKRTLVVLPVDNPEIRDIEVNVLQGVTDDIYEHVFLVRNVSHTNTKEIVDGSLYVDFAMTPGIKIISHNDAESASEGTSCDEKPPPRPPKPGHLAKPAVKRPVPAPKPSKKKKDEQVETDEIYIVPEPTAAMERATSKVQKKKASVLKRSTSVSSGETGDYEVPDDPITTSPTTNDYAGFSLADMDFSVVGSGKSSLGKKFSKGLVSNLKSSLQKGLRGSKEHVSAKLTKKKTDEGKTLGYAPDRKQASIEEDAEYSPGLYDEVDELQMIDYPFRKSQQYHKGRNEGDKGTDMRTIHQKPTARVQPSSMSATVGRKLFKDLNNEELVDRLNMCGMADFARFCTEQNLNGSFFLKLSKETLQRDMNLKKIELAKFMQMRDENWVPS